MGISKSGQGSLNSLFSISEIQTLFPNNFSVAYYNYILSAIDQGYTKSELFDSTFLSTAAFQDYIADGGYTIETISGQLYAKKQFLSGTSSFNAGIFNGDNANVIVVGGGGAGGWEHAGGGGAGGVVWHQSFNITGNITVTVGPGGVGSASNAPTMGSDSVCGTLVAKGGGGGGRWSDQRPGLSGGSGGGGTLGDSAGNYTNGVSSSTQQSFAGAIIYGNRGGYGYYNGGSPSRHAGGGGGGAGGAGADAVPNSRGGNGGSGVTILGQVFAAGGGGATSNTGGGQGAGGSGIGGNGTDTGTQATSGAVNTGSGGGGGHNNGANPAGTGGSGIVIIRFPFTMPTVLGA
jgi:hypothetical protein